MAGLLDLPDDVLRVVAQREMYGRHLRDIRALVPLLLTCHWLAAVGCSSVECLSIRRGFAFDLCPPRRGSSVEPLVSTSRDRMARHLASLCAFLSHVHRLRDVDLSDWAEQTTREPGEMATFRL